MNRVAAGLAVFGAIGCVSVVGIGEVCPPDHVFHQCAPGLVCVGNRDCDEGRMESCQNECRPACADDAACVAPRCGCDAGVCVDAQGVTRGCWNTAP
jgi:hypothetical protein